jgi:hypothetical protein
LDKNFFEKNNNIKLTKIYFLKKKTMLNDKNKKISKKKQWQLTKR